MINDDIIKAVAEKSDFLNYQHEGKMYYEHLAAACKAWMVEKNDYGYFAKFKDELMTVFLNRTKEVLFWMVRYNDEDVIKAFHQAFCEGKE